MLFFKTWTSFQPNFFDNELIQLSYINNNAKKSIKEKLEFWLMNELFVDEKRNLLKATGEEFNPDYYIAYLTEKFTKLYEL